VCVCVRTAIALCYISPHTSIAFKSVSSHTDKKCAMWTSCLYPYRDAGYVLASMELWATGVDISVTSSRFNQYRVQEVTKILFNSKVLPFCEDVSKIILRYLCL